MQATVGNRGEDLWKLPRDSCRVDPLEGGLLGEVKLADAVRMHGRVPSRCVQPACIDLRKMGKELGRPEAVASDQSVQITKQSFIVDV